MGLSTAERNRRKRERKKKERVEQRKLGDDSPNDIHQQQSNNENEDNYETKNIEITYVPEPLKLPDVEGGEFEAVRIFQERSAAVITDDEHQVVENKKDSNGVNNNDSNEDGDYDDDDTNNDRGTSMAGLSKRKLRELIRPTISELKQRVKRPDLVEAHDITAPDPEFLIYLKSVPGTVQVPRHWGRKRKYLQGKRGFEKPPFQLPDFIVKTGITEIRDTVAVEEEKMSIRQKNRQRVAPKMGAIDVDYGTLHAAFFKHQTKPKDLTKFGDLYYEGKELEAKTNSIKPGKTLSKGLRDALGMTTPSAPPPWLINMQRYGPPPSWSGIPIPGLNAPLPSIECQYGFHPGGWGKPPIDSYGRPLYGGNPFDPPGTAFHNGMMDSNNLVTSDGKTLNKTEWGALPTVNVDEVVEDEPSEDDMESSSDEEDDDEGEGEKDAENEDGNASVVMPPTSAVMVAPGNLRKDAAGDETPIVSGPPKQLYQVIEQRNTTPDQTAIFASAVSYVVPSITGGATNSASAVPEGAESVLSKVLPGNQQSARSKRKDDDDDDIDVGKNFKF